VSAESVAREHYRGRHRLADAVARLAAQLWRRIDPANLDHSWAAVAPQLLIGVAGAQLAAARTADDYLDGVLSAQDASPAADMALVPDALAGVASDGRPLDSLLVNSVFAVKAAIGDGAPVDLAMATGYANLDMLVRTQVADAGRAADQVSLVAHRAAGGYVRMVVGKTCSRCIVLAGRHYEWNAGFLRHPRCDCIHIPAAESLDSLRTNPRALFDAMSRPEQDKTFTKAGAEAIRDGSDIGRVVNARRGMYEAGGKQLTTEATTRAGVNRRIRLMPEQIYREAGGDREEALRLLRAHGYLRQAPSRVRVPQPRPPVRETAPVPAVPRSLADRVKAGITDRRLLSGGQNAKTELLTLADGSKVVFKKARPIEGVSARTQQDAEQLLPIVLRAAGLRAPDIYRPTANQLYMEYFEGDIASKHRLPGSHRINPADFDADQGLLLGLVDQITDNYDRNGGNWLIAADRTVRPIDHGFAFSYYGSSPAHAVRMMVDQPGAAFHGSRTPHIDEWADNDMSPADLALLRSKLERLLPEFRRLGREDWHAKMLIRLEQIERHARGSKRRIR
jgi:hypothetical protein